MSMFQNKNDRHLRNSYYSIPGAVVYGRLIEAGETLEAIDVYESTSGEWEVCPCPGLKLGVDVDCRWVRPIGDK